jgi:hypothetical protein
MPVVKIAEQTMCNKKGIVKHACMQHTEIYTCARGNQAVTDFSTAMLQTVHFFLRG